MSLREQAIKAVEDNIVPDLNDTTTGGNFERRLLPTGHALVRFTGYIEYGVQEQKPVKGQAAKPPAPEAKLVFHVVAGTGKDAAGQRAPMVTQEEIDRGFYPRAPNNFNIVLSVNEKSNSTKIFNAMNYAGDAKHFAELLGRLYFLPITVTEDGKYNRCELKQLSAPVNPVDGELVSAPDVPEDIYQLLLWNAPTKEQWDSIYIDGTNSDGTTKNYIQEQIMKATNFLGSPLEQLLMSGGTVVPSLEAETTGASTELPEVPDV